MSVLGWIDRLLTDAAWVGVGLGLGIGAATTLGFLEPRVPGMCGTTVENMAPIVGLWFLVLRWTGRLLLRLSAWCEQRLERWELDHQHRKLKIPPLDEL